MILKPIVIIAVSVICSVIAVVAIIMSVSYVNQKEDAFIEELNTALQNSIFSLSSCDNRICAENVASNFYDQFDYIVEKYGYSPDNPRIIDMKSTVTSQMDYSINYIDEVDLANKRYEYDSQPQFVKDHLRENLISQLEVLRSQFTNENKTESTADFSKYKTIKCPDLYSKIQVKVTSGINEAVNYLDTDRLHVKDYNNDGYVCISIDKSAQEPIVDNR